MSDRQRRAIGVLAVVAICGAATACANRRSSLLLERQALGPIAEESGIARGIEWAVEPVTQPQAQSGLEAIVTYATRDYLTNFFQNKKVFGSFAGMNPYFPEQLVFYVKLTNHTGKKIRIVPNDFVLLDDLGNQYHVLNPDYNTALAEAKAPMATLTRGVLEDAHPGYFGVGVPVGKIIGKPMQRFALLKMASLQEGYLYDGVIYDGLIAFWSPHEKAQHLKLLLTNIKTDFNANDWPQTTIQLSFEYAIRQHRGP